MAIRVPSEPPYRLVRVRRRHPGKSNRARVNKSPLPTSRCAPSHQVLGRKPQARGVGGEWAYKPKWDRFRGVVCVAADGCRIWTRPGVDVTRCFPEIADAALKRLPSGSVPDGELVVWARDGSTSVPCSDMSSCPAVCRPCGQPAGHVHAFDVLAVAGSNVRRLTLQQRCKGLAEMLNEDPGRP